MSTFDIACPHCGQTLEANDELVRTMVKCPSCNRQFSIPRHHIATQGQIPVKNNYSAKKRHATPILLIAISVVIACVIIGGIILCDSIVKHRKQTQWSKYREQQIELSNRAKSVYDKAMKYYDGTGVMQDYSKARDLLEEASALGSADANGQLAFMYWAGKGNVAENEEKAVEYALKSGSQRSGLASLILGDCYLYGYKTSSGTTESDFPKAYECFADSAKSGYFKARFFKGLMLYHGVGIEKNESEAAKTFYQCCQSKPDSEWAGKSALCLGYMYWKGIGVGENLEMAKQWMMWGGEHANCLSMVSQERKYPGDMDLCLTAAQFYYVIKFRL